MSDSESLPSAIVLGTAVNGLGVLRSLGRLGIRCGATYAPTPGDQAVYSKYLKAGVAVSASATDESIMAGIDQVCDKLDAVRPVLIPTTDRYAQFLANNQNALIERYSLRCAESSLNDAFLDKWKTVAICHENEILTPMTVCPMLMDDLRALSSTLPYPVIVKPRYTFDASFPGKNSVAESRVELLDFFDRHDVLGKSVIQEIVPSGDGDILVVATYSDGDGKVTATYSGKKLRQLMPDYGATCFGISERQPDLEQIGTMFLNKVGYRGLGAMEFARSRIDRRCYFLELNVRSYYHNQLFADAGVDLSVQAYQDIAGKRIAQSSDRSAQRVGIVWLDFRRDFASMRIKRSRGQITFWQWALSLPRARSFACWNWRDPLPFVRACVWRIGWRLRQIVSRAPYRRRRLFRT